MARLKNDILEALVKKTGLSKKTIQNNISKIRQQNAQLTAASTRIQAVQTARTVAQSLGTTEADVAGAGFTQSGSALDILASSAQQGALAKSLVNIQGAINENAYAAEAGANLAKAKAAKEANTAGTVSAIASIGGALLSGGEQLASAGKTVVQGYNTIKGWFAPSTSDLALQDTSGLAASFDPGSAADLPWLSQTDQSIQAGSSIFDNSVTLDTSAPSLLGQSVSDVGSAISGAFNSVSTALSAGVDSIFGAGAGAAIGSALGSIIPGLGLVSLVDMIPGVSDIPVVGPVLGAINSGISAVENGVVSVASDVGNAIGSVFGSVICTALYRRGRLTRAVWNGAQRYGRDIAPAHVYYAYLLWGRPIARMIEKHDWIAAVVAPIFVPWAHELARRAGEKTARFTVAGWVIFNATYAFSSALGWMMHKRRDYVKA